MRERLNANIIEVIKVISSWENSGLRYIEYQTQVVKGTLSHHVKQNTGWYEFNGNAGSHEQLEQV